MRWKCAALVRPICSRRDTAGARHSCLWIGQPSRLVRSLRHSSAYSVAPVGVAARGGCREGGSALGNDGYGTAARRAQAPRGHYTRWRVAGAVAKRSRSPHTYGGPKECEFLLQ